MFKVLTGSSESWKVSWMRGKLMSKFDYLAKPEWFMDEIVKDELRDVDKVVSIDRVVFTTDSGRVIPTNWLSQGSRQFIYMTVDNRLVCDSSYFGSNVYKYFFRWATERDKDVIIRTCDAALEGCPENIYGVFLNTGEKFTSLRKLRSLILNNRNVMLSEIDEEGYITEQKYVGSIHDETFKRYGKIRKIKLDLPVK